MILVFTCVVFSLNAQTVAKYHKHPNAIQKKINQSGGLRTTSTPTYCPSGPVTFNAYDTNNVSIGNATGVTLACNARPFYIDANNNGDVVTPCILSEYTSTDLFLSNNGTEYFYEGGVNTFCLGRASTGCSFSIGSGGFDANHQWGVLDIFSDPSKQHNYQFCYQGLPLMTTTVQLQDCWSGDSLSPSNSFGLILPNPCFTDSVLANTDIGTASYSIAPASATVALTDYHNGEAYVDPSLLLVGTYTVTYNFTPPAADGCTTVNGTFTFSIGPLALTVNSPTICAGNSATLTASGPPAATYSWSPSTDLSATTGAAVIATPTATTSIYTVTGTKGNCTATATSTVTIKPALTLTVNSPSVCIGSSAILIASGATTYTWSPTSGLSTTTGSTVTTHTLSTNAVYTVNATSLGCTAKATTTVTVNSAPTLAVNSPSVCAGSTATLTASGATNYTWSPATGLSATTGSVVTANLSSSAHYTVTGNSGGCFATKTATVTVNSLPTITVNSPTICTGGSATLTAGGPAATTYSWSPSTDLSTTTGATVIATPTPTASTYIVTGTKSGCSATATSTVTIKPTLTLTVNSPSVCAGSSAILTASGATTYTWSPTSGLSTTTGSTVTTHTLSTNAVYTVNATSLGCTAKATTTVTVNSAPTLAVNSPSVCAGSTATLTANGATNYTWSPATGLSAISGSVVTADLSSSTHYTVTGNLGGCSSVKTITVTIYPLPTISVNSATICATGSVVLTAGGATTYTWNTNAISASITSSPIVTTIYTVTGTDINACENSATSTISVNPLPVVTLTANSVICVGQTINLTANNVGSAIYTWSGPNGFVSSSQNPTITNAAISNTGIYTLTISSGGCSASSTVNVVVDAMPTIANAGPDTILYNSSLSMSGNVPLVGTGVWVIITGNGNILNSNQANTQVTNLQSGQNTLQWIISNGTCPASYDNIIINVKDLIIPNGFSPNGDGVNDNFEINGLEEYTNVKINVFNRWGNLVYDSGDYKNNWGGKNMSGEDLSDDTYFFTLEIPNKNTVKGYVVLKRK